MDKWADDLPKRWLLDPLGSLIDLVRLDHRIYTLITLSAGHAIFHVASSFFSHSTLAHESYPAAQLCRSAVTLALRTDQMKRKLNRSSGYYVVRESFSKPLSNSHIPLPSPKADS